MKRPYKVYLTNEEHQALLTKAKELGLEGKGALSKFISKLAFEKIIFADKNLQQFLELINFSTSPKHPQRNIKK